MVGPTGVGKTTTIAKLAGRMRGQAKRDVAILTFDTYRIGAVEQIATYAGMLGCPFETILSPDAAAEAVDRHRGRDVVLVDTTGRSPFDAERLTHMAETLASIDLLEVLLVLPAPGSLESLRAAARRFAALRPRGSS